MGTRNGLIVLLILLKIVSVCAQSIQKDSTVKLFLIGLHSSNNPIEDKLFKMVADSFRVKVDSTIIVDSFVTGKGLFELLIKHSKRTEIKTLILLGHSGAAGYFVERNSGFYHDSFQEYPPGKKLIFTKSTRRISDLNGSINRKLICFDEDATIIALGCNTGGGTGSFAEQLCKITGITTIGTSQQVGFYQKNNIGIGIVPTKYNSAFMAFSKQGQIVTQKIIRCSDLKGLYNYITNSQ